MSKFRSRLGRGLNSLISVSDLPIERDLPAPPPQSLSDDVSDSDRTSPRLTASAALPDPHPLEASSEGMALNVPLDSIVPNPHQPRRQMDEAGLAELAASMKGSGVIQPVIVRQRDNHYELIAGERRWRAAQLAGLSALPVIVRDVDSFAQAQMALVENIQRENLNPIDRAVAYRTLIGQLGLTQAELATRLGEDRSTIANFLRLLELPEPVQACVSDGRLSLGHAKLLAGVADILEQERLANLVMSQELSVRSLETLIRQGNGSPATRPPAVSPHLQDLAKNLSRQLGLRVEVRAAARKGKGKVILHYGSLDQFDELLNRLGVQADE